MKLSTASCRVLIEVTPRASATVCRAIHTSASTSEAWSRDKGSSSGGSRSKQYNERRKQNKVSNTLLTASRLGRHADSISKDSSDRYSGWKHTAGPSTRRNVGRPKLSREAGKSMARAIASENVETLLGPHSSRVLLQSLLPAEDLDDDGFRASGSWAKAPRLSSRDFITPKRDLQAGDFVEVRRGSPAVGIVLPPPDDWVPADRELTRDERTRKGMKDLFVLVTTGSIVMFKDNDVMMQIPGVIDRDLAQSATAPSHRYIVSSNSLDAPINTDGSHDSHSSTSSAEADPVEGTALQEEPVDEARFQARASICNKLRILERQKEKELLRLLPSFQSLFLVDRASLPAGEAAELRKQRMDLRTGSITTFEAARLMHEHAVRTEGRQRGQDAPALTASTVYAAHSLLMSQPTHFLADALSHRTSQLFTCRSDAERANLEQIATWIAGPPGSEGQEIIDAFCHKAGKVRQWAEAHPHDASGPPRIVEVPSAEVDVEWTAQDRAIIEFLQTSLGSRREVQEDTHGSIAMQIIKRAGGHFRVLPHPDTSELLDVDTATRLLLVEQERELGLGKAMFETIGTDLHAGGDLQHALVMRFLTSIGALPPWQNPIRLDASFRSATLGEDGGEPEREPGATETEASTSAVSPAAKFNVTLNDELEAIRHDFGSEHTVFVIDDEGAFELDDGISIEPVKGREADQVWVHVHIADPTAWVQPDDELGQRAERRFQTIYLPEARWAMLPDDFVRSGVGLRATSSLSTEAQSQGQRVMTFSALIDLSNGLVQDTRVRPALVHNVQTMSYHRVSSILVDPSSGEGDSRSAKLALLLQAATKVSESRTRSSAFNAYQAQPTLSLSPLPLPSVPVSPSALQRPYFFAGFPTISVSSTRSHRLTASEDSPALAQFLVSEMMILAGRVAASYGTQHKLAFAYRYQLRPESEVEARDILALRRNVPDETGTSSLIDEAGMIGHGMIQYEDIQARGYMIRAGGYSVRPSEHFSLGITADPTSPFVPAPHRRDALTLGGYTRATSPLRRFPDMLTHWQIKHHLVHGRPRFRTHEIERVLPQLERQEVTAKQLMRSAQRYWLHALLQRSLLDKNFTEGALRGPFTAQVTQSEVRFNVATMMGRVRVYVQELGMPADLQLNSGEAPPTAGESFKVMPTAVIMAGIRSGLLVHRA